MRTSRHGAIDAHHSSPPLAGTDLFAQPRWAASPYTGSRGNAWRWRGVLSASDLHRDMLPGYRPGDLAPKTTNEPCNQGVPHARVTSLTVREMVHAPREPSPRPDGVTELVAQ